MTEPPAALRQVLLPGEEVCWHGRPRATEGIGWGIGLSLFGIFWTVMVARAPFDGPIFINNVPVDDPATRWAAWAVFLFVGIAMSLALPGLMMAVRRTAYAVTDRRVLEVMRLPVIGSLHSYLPARIWGTERANKRGAEATGCLDILRPAPSGQPAGAGGALVRFFAIQDDIGAQAAVHALVAAPRPTMHDAPGPAPALQALFDPTLRPGEALLWAAQPDRAAYAWATLVPSVLILFFLSPVFVALLGDQFSDPMAIGYGAFLLVAPGLAWRRASFTAYGVTTERVIVLDRRPARGIRTTWPLGVIERIERSWPLAGAGSLAVRHARDRDAEGHPARLVLRALPDAAAAEAALFVALDGLRRDAAAPTRQDATP
ncbi:hypothetical protein [Falsiroseomonas stagni]|uniref:Uncharacterized protein n=1 Tax=Falsiroseomonas stagni DSM 19981 TaxID=1123062 RepID=A0A1I4ABI2_9PROT|nr:hypothetical protein [Falsiroseomonas stagni]SFK53768.1 hypothetical protein SAMN02745775_103312 [Falsiroseomonas stagni DSM 19981]